jgi:hypothetical protein
MPAWLVQQDYENLQTSQVFKTCEVSSTGFSKEGELRRG